MQGRTVGCAAAARLMGISDRALRKQIATGKLAAEENGRGYAVALDDALARASPEQRMLWHESQSAITATVTAADLATYKAAFGEDGLQKLAERQQAVITLDGILSGGDRGRGALIEALAGQLGVSSRTLRRWHTAYKDGGLAAIMEKTERKDKGKTRSMCQLTQDWIEARMCDNRKFPQTLILDRLREKERELADGACDVCPYCEWSAAREALKPEELAEYPMCQQATGRLIIPANRHAINRFVETLDKAQLTYARRGKRAWEAAFIRRAVDLEESEQKSERLGILAFTGAKNAHQLILTVFENDKPVTFASASNVMAYFMRAGENVTIKADVTANVVTVKFPAAAYAVQERVSVLVCLENTEEKVPLYAAVFDPGSGSEDVIIDPDDVVPSVSDIIEQLEEMKNARTEIQEAVNKANEAISHTPYINAETGTWHVWNAENGAYVDTGSVAAGPKGDDGITPHIGDNGNWWIGGTDTGTAAQGPAGANGTGSGTVTGVTVNGTTYEPDESGVVELPEMGSSVELSDSTPSALGENASAGDGEKAAREDHVHPLPTANQVGAAAADHTHSGYAAADHAHTQYATTETVSQLSEQMVNYRTAVNLLDNSMFEIAQAGYGAMHGTQRYVCDRWYNSFGFGDFSFEKGKGLTIAYETNHAYVCQKLPDESFAGKPLTFAVCLSDGTVHTCSGVYIDTNATAIKEFDNAIIGIYEGEVRIIVTEGSCTVRWAALYEGEYTAETLPPYVPKGYAAELAECQRYYKPQMSFNLYCYADGYLFGHMFETQMRIAPTFTVVAVYTAVWDEVDDETTIGDIASNGFGYVHNVNFKAGEHYRIYAIPSADL